MSVISYSPNSSNSLLSGSGTTVSISGNTLSFAATSTTPAVNQAAAATASAGQAMSIYAQTSGATSASVGAILKIGGGAGAVSGTNLAGDTQIDLGTLVSTASAKLSLLSSGTSFCDITSYTSGGCQISTLAQYLVIKTGRFNLTDNSGNVVLTWNISDTNLAVGVSNFGFTSTATTPKFLQADNAANSATGAAMTLHSQNCTGTTSIGGSLTISSGTGTSTKGTLALQAGGTTRMTIDNTGIGFYATAGVAQASRSGQLTDNTGGTPGSTLASFVGTTYSTDSAAIKNTISSLATKINNLETIIHNLGISA